MCLSVFQPPHLRVKKIFVGGLKPETTDQQIRDYFGSHYAPVSCHFIVLFRKIYLISLTEGFFTYAQKCTLPWIWVLHIKQTFSSFSYDFMFDRITCVLVRIKVRGHDVMSIIQFTNLISVHFWTYCVFLALKILIQLYSKDFSPLEFSLKSLWYGKQNGGC